MSHADLTGVSASTRTILLGTDFSPEADKAFRVAADIARTLGASLEVAHVHPMQTYVLPPPLDIVAVPDQDGQVAETRANLEQRRQDAETEGVAAVTALLTGEPAATLVERAKEIGAYLLVVGSHGSSRLAHVLLGSVAERVVRHATCPVLVVPHRS